MKTFSFRFIQSIPTDLETAWNFFSSPENLKTITPDKLGFRILSKYHGPVMYPGQLIEYKVKPVLSIPIYWMTEITHVEHNKYFIDEQRFGPYAFWHHQHHFALIDGGVQMTDIVHYRNPAGILGVIVNPLIERQLNQIFAFRFKKVEEIFGQWIARSH